jgi:16S rRNA (cytosine1402-N4)-methyltransferase
MLAEGLGKRGLLIGLEVDPANLEVCRRRLADLSCRVELVHENFAELPAVLASLGVEQVDVLFADLGVCSAQLDDGARGFSFLHDGPLDMRMDPRLTTTAADLVNRLKERELADLLFYNAQEYSSRRIARRICELRREARIKTTRRLAEIVAGALGVDPESRKEKIHPATKTFQALRIAVNDEIRCLERLLEFAPDVLRSGGRFGVVSFHSIEDKPVKLDFRKRQGEGLYRIETKRPVVADEAERSANPRSRSAKLRVAVRLPEG